MGEIRAKIRLENTDDRTLFKKGLIAEREIRVREIEAVADTGAVMNVFPQDLIEDLGLAVTGREIVLLANDQKVELPTAGDFVITVAGRSWRTDCLVGPPGCEALIGQLVMERLDLIADPRQRTLTVRPESPLRPTTKLKELARR